MIDKIKIIKNNSNVLFIGLIGLLIPFYVRGIVVEQTDIEVEVYKVFTSPFNVDLFSVSKARLLLVLISIITVQFLILFLKNKIELKLDISYIFLVGFLAIIYVSSTFSEYKEISYVGFSERYEGMYVYFYYVLIVIFSHWLIRTEENIDFIYWCISLSVIPVLMIGLFQAFDVPFILSYPLKPFMFDLNDVEYNLIINFFIGKNRELMSEGFNIVASTLFNPNYLGVYSITVFFITQLLLLKSISKLKKIVLFVLNLFSFVLLLISGSNTGFYLVIIMYLAVVGLFFVRYKAKYLKLFITQAIFFVLSFILMNSITDGKINDMYFKVLVNKYIDATVDSEKNTRYLIESIVINSEETIIKDTNSEIILVIEEGVPVVSNQNILIENSQWEAELQGEVLILRHYGKKIYFGISPDNKIGIRGPKNLVTDIEEPIKLIVDGSLFTYRGYIWSNAISLIKDKPILGHGADTFGIYQPNDIINRINYTSGANSVIYNPHNMYLSILFNFGLTGFVALFGFVLILYIKAIIIYIRDKGMRDRILHVFIPLTIFFMMSFLNDTIVGTGVIFYILLGIAGVTIFSKTIFLKEDIKDIEYLK